MGPGPFTGLRVGVVTARVFGRTLGIPVHGVCTLDALARAAAGRAGQDFLAVTDARRKELYWARYSAAGERLDGPAVNRPDDLPPGLPLAGQAVSLYPALGQSIWPEHPSAAVLATLAAERLAAGQDFLPPEPLYLRRPDAQIPGPPKRVTA